MAAETQVKPDRALLFIIATCPDIMLDMVMDMTQCLRLHKAVLKAIAAGGDSSTSPGTYRLTWTPAWTSFSHLTADLKNLDKRTLTYTRSEGVVQICPPWK